MGSSEAGSKALERLMKRIREERTGNGTQPESHRRRVNYEVCGVMNDMSHDMDALITPVPVEVLETIWPEASVFIERAVNTTKGKFTLDSVYQDIKRGLYVLWIIVKDDVIMAALTTRIAQYPLRKGLSIDWLGGSNMSELFTRTFPTIVQYAKDNGCTHLEGYGRKAWGKWLESYGWEPDYVAYKMELSDGR
jgi:hypothetical protein